MRESEEVLECYRAFNENDIMEPSSGTASSSLTPGYFAGIQADRSRRVLKRKKRLDELDGTNLDDDDP